MLNQAEVLLIVLFCIVGLALKLVRLISILDTATKLKKEEDGG
jgi:hypothetical protein